MRLNIDISDESELSLYVVNMHMGNLPDSACIGSWNQIIFHNIFDANAFIEVLDKLPYIDNSYELSQDTTPMAVVIAISKYKQFYLYKHTYKIRKYTIASTTLTDTAIRKEIIDYVLKEI